MLLEAARRDGVGKNKKRARVPHLLIEPLEQKPVLVVEHRLEPGPANVAIGRAINRVAELHVVSRHRLRDRAGCAANLEKATRHFLPGADFRESPVALPVEIDLERFLVRSDIHLRVHGKKCEWPFCPYPQGSHNGSGHKGPSHIRAAPAPRSWPESSPAGR